MWYLLDRKLFLLVLLVTGIFIGEELLIAPPVFSGQTSQVMATVKISVCGNGVKEGGEQCDINDFGGNNCQTLGYDSGTLKCNNDCTFNASDCTTSSGGGGGAGGGGSAGGGGGYITPSAPQISFDGIAYPNSEVTLLEDGQVVASTVASTDAKFHIDLNKVATGNYIFSLYSEDNKGNRSSLHTFPLTVTSQSSVKIGSIFISPTISTDKIEVKKGESVLIFGESAPKSQILISVHSDQDHFVKTTARDDGSYLYYFDSSVLDYGQHFTKSKSSLNNLLVTNDSKAVSFKVGDQDILRSQSGCARADLNCDGKINLIDFSIAAYWYHRSLSQDFASLEKERLNGDGKINLVDFSIMAYYWTG